ncbi:MAG TPA: molybdopterin-dependent oxidoreductase [bacterium]|nr:molybdopterin-dependent oxidoreductase [bacterium]
MPKRPSSLEPAGPSRGGFDRRDFIKIGGMTTLFLSLRTLAPKAASGQDAGPRPAEPYQYRSWEDLYRDEWKWDKVAKCTHSWANCSGGCVWDVLVKDNLVWREEQSGTYTRENDFLPDYNPRGCQKGACYSELMYNPGRIKYPLKRVGERGSGKWQRISWDQALTEIADQLIDVIYEYGSDTLCHDLGPNFGNGPNTISKLRFMYYLGGYMHDSWAEIGDLSMGSAVTLGMAHAGGSSSDWFKSDYVVMWMFNPVVTRIPEAHFLTEMRYNGSTVVSIAPDYNPSTIHADLWINPEIATDGALALAAVHIIIRDKLYNREYIKWQTDLPFLVRQDNKRFLRESDLAPGGKEGNFYTWDTAADKPALMPGTWESPVRSTDLGPINPALEGEWEVKLKDGASVKVTTVFELIKKLVLENYSPEQAGRVCKLDPELIEKFARDFAAAKRPMIISQWGSNKLYHSDLHIRARLLMLSLVGAVGRRGAGFQSIGWYGFESFELFAFMPLANTAGVIGALSDVPEGQSMWEAIDVKAIKTLLKQRYSKKLLSIPELEQVEQLEDTLLSRYVRIGPGVLFTYVHGGLSKISGKREYNDPALPRSVDDYVNESIDKGWMPLMPGRGRTPRVWITGGNSILRRLRSWPVMLEHMWPELKLVIDMNWRVSSTGLYSDYILPVAGWYEKTGMKYPIGMIPFVNYCDKAVDPLYESKTDWEIYGLLAQRISQRAKERGKGEFKTATGHKRNLRDLYKFYTFNHTIGLDHKGEEKLFQAQLDFSSSTKGITVKQLKKDGCARFKSVGMVTPMAHINTDMRPDDSVSPSTDFIDRKRPWPTITGRQQYYIDHEWYLEVREEMPVHKDPPLAGGNYPMILNGAHARWTIHSMWQDDKYMSRLQRGVPLIHLSPADAEARGIEDHDYVRVFNDVDSFNVHVKICPSIRPGQVMMYHAWELFQFDKLKSNDALIPSPMKPLHLAGGYGQLKWRFAHCQPCQVDRDTRVEVEKISGPGKPG